MSVEIQTESLPLQDTSQLQGEVNGDWDILERKIEVLLDCWLGDNRSKVHGAFYREIDKYMTEKDVFLRVVRLAITHAFKKQNIAEIQPLLLEWHRNLNKLYPICDAAFSSFINTITGNLKRAEFIIVDYAKYNHTENTDMLLFLLRQQVVSQLFALLECDLAAFHRYAMSRGMAYGMLQRADWELMGV